MNQTKKILISIALIILIGLGVGAWLITSKFDSQAVRKYATETLSQQYHRELTISGDLKLQIFPTIAIVANGVELSNPDKFPVGQFIHADLVKINVAVLPLLVGQIQVEEVGAEGLILNLLTLGDGRHNWDFDNTAKNASENLVNDKSTKDNNLLGFNIDRINLVSGKLTYRDHRSNSSYLVDIPKATINQSREKSNLDILLIKDGSKVQITGQIKFDAVADNQAQLKLLINQQSININGSWINPVDLKTPSTIKVKASLQADFIDLPAIRDLLQSNKANPLNSSPNKKLLKVNSSNRIFSSEPIAWSDIPMIDGDIQFQIKQLKLSDQRTLGAVLFDAHIGPNEINIPNIKLTMNGGSFNGQFKAMDYRSNAPTMQMVGRGQGFTAEKIVALSGSIQKMRGGPTEFGFNLRGSAKSLHDFVSTLNGQSQIVIGQAQLASSKLNQSGDLLMSLIKLIDPRRSHTDTALVCAAAYLPVKNGVIGVSNSIGLETDQLYLQMAGVINLANETLQLGVKARDPSGITTGISLASMVQIEGSLVDPQIGINKAGVKQQGLNLGLGILTAGISILAENANSIKDKSRPCQTATRPWPQVLGN